MKIQVMEKRSHLQFRRAGGRALDPPSLGGQPPEDPPVRHARVRAAAGAVERHALGPRGAALHGDQLQPAALAASYLQRGRVVAAVAPAVRVEGQERRRRRRDGGSEHDRPHGSVGRRMNTRDGGDVPRAAMCGMAASWRPQKLDQGQGFGEQNNGFW